MTYTYIHEHRKADPIIQQFYFGKLILNYSARDNVYIINLILIA